MAGNCFSRRALLILAACAIVILTYVNVISFHGRRVPDWMDESRRAFLDFPSNVRLKLPSSPEPTSLASKFVLEDVATTKNDVNIGSCTAFSNNSETWLKGERFGNVDDPLMGHPGFLRKMIVDLPNTLSRSDGARALLGQSLCHERSRLLNDDKQELSANNSRSVRLWAVRLAYLALHYHQHRLAIPEARARLNDGTKCEQVMKDNAIGRFDYECPDAKYLVISLGGFGLGVNIRILAVSALILGLVHDRVVLFMNNSPYANGGVCPGATPNCKWMLVSCTRKDFQCFFFPPSPCTLTHDQLTSAYFWTKKKTRALALGGMPELSDMDKNNKVWVVPAEPGGFSKLGKLGTPKAALQCLSGYVNLFLSIIPPGDPRIPILKAASEEVQVKDTKRSGYHYLAASDKVRHAAVFYAMRPGLQQKLQLDSILNEIIPQNMVTKSSIGLPIRASDKCKFESDCLTFDQHIEVTTNVWRKHLKNTSEVLANPTILFTSESKEMAMEQLNFAANSTRQARYAYKYNFLSNTRDVSPNSGFVKDIRRQKLNFSAGDSLMGAISSLKFQLLPQISIGNCCSNFHILLFDFLTEGCGAADDNTVMCLNEYEDRSLRTCCGWHNECKELKKQHIENMQTSLVGSAT